MSKNSTGKVTMKRLLLALLLAAFSSVLMAQANRSAELDKAVEDARAAYLALQEAEKRRDAGVGSQPGGRQPAQRAVLRPPGATRAGSGVRAPALRGCRQALERSEVTSSVTMRGP